MSWCNTKKRGSEVFELTEIGAAGGAGPNETYHQKDTQPANNSMKDLGSDTFLKLLITQMRYQDPFSGGGDMGDFMTQVAQFTTMERLIQLQKTVENFAVQQAHSQALGMLNRTVEVKTGDGTEVRGEVTAVRLQGGSPLLTVNGREYPIGSVSMVSGSGHKEAGPEAE